MTQILLFKFLILPHHIPVFISPILISFEFISKATDNEWIYYMFTSDWKIINELIWRIEMSK
jgi:hypothetical protein